MLVGLVMGHAQAMAGQAMGFLVLDRLGGDLMQGQQAVGLVLMTGAFAALLVQWGLIPLLDMKPRMLVIVGLALGAAGCLMVSAATTLYGLAVAFAIACAGFGFARPGYTAGSSLAVGPELQGAVAGRVTSINGASFVLGPSIGIGLYEIWQPLPYLAAAVLSLVLLVYAVMRLQKNESTIA